MTSQLGESSPVRGVFKPEHGYSRYDPETNSQLLSDRFVVSEGTLDILFSHSTNSP